MHVACKCRQVEHLTAPDLHSTTAAAAADFCPPELINLQSIHAAADAAVALLDAPWMFWHCRTPNAAAASLQHTHTLSRIGSFSELVRSNMHCGQGPLKAPATCHPAPLALTGTRCCCRAETMRLVSALVLLLLSSALSPLGQQQQYCTIEHSRICRRSAAFHLATTTTSSSSRTIDVKPDRLPDGGRFQLDCRHRQLI